MLGHPLGLPACLTESVTQQKQQPTLPHSFPLRLSVRRPARPGREAGSKEASGVISRQSPYPCSHDRRAHPTLLTLSFLSAHPFALPPSERNGWRHTAPECLEDTRKETCDFCLHESNQQERKNNSQTGTEPEASTGHVHTTFFFLSSHPSLSTVHPSSQQEDRQKKE